MKYELVVMRGPLPGELRGPVIAGWGAYDPRLLDPEEWADEFERGPEGPALHVLVVADDGRVIGHHCAIPLRFRLGGKSLLLGKGEAIYVQRDKADRGGRVEFEGRRVRFVEALTSVLYARYREFGLEAYFGYATPQAERRHVEAGCVVVELPYRRFFDVRDPAAAVAASPRLGSGFRARGARALLVVARALPRGRGPRLPVRPMDEFDCELDETFRDGLDRDLLALDPTAAQLNWRFAGRGYQLLLVGDPPWGYAVLSTVEPSGRRRIVDWLVPGDRVGEVPALARALIEAGADGAALEWAVPVSAPPGARLARALRHSPFLPDPRRRSYRMVVHGPDSLTRPEAWSLTLATQERF